MVSIKIGSMGGMFAIEKWGAVFLSLVALTACSQTTTERLNLRPLQTVDQVQLAKYTGKWFDIAHFPQSFQKNCFATSATYTARSDGDIDVLNQCKKGSLDGKIDTAKGLARVVDAETNAKLKVSFFRPFWGEYWIIELGDDYQYAVVGHPSRDYLWILSRTSQMDAAVYEGIIKRIKSKGYDPSRLERTVQED